MNPNPDPSRINPLPQSLSPDPIVIINVPISTKLTRTNFLAWQSQILPVLHGYGLHKYITTTAPELTITSDAGIVSTNPLALPWHKQDHIILTWLRSSLSETLLGQVVLCSTSVDLWQNLQQTFSASSRARHTEFCRKLQNTTKGRSSCSYFLHKMLSIANESAFIGSPVFDYDLSMYILGGLGSEFNSAVAAVTTRPDPYSIQELYAFLVSFESLIISQNSTYSPLPSNPDPSAYYSNNTCPYNSGPNNNYCPHSNSGPRPNTRPPASRPVNSTAPGLLLNPTGFQSRPPFNPRPSYDNMSYEPRPLNPDKNEIY